MFVAYGHDGSPEDGVGGDMPMFWSNEWGWTADLSEATRFDEGDTAHLRPPVGFVAWLTVEEAARKADPLGGEGA